MPLSRIICRRSRISACLPDHCAREVNVSLETLISMRCFHPLQLCCSRVLLNLLHPHGFSSQKATICSWIFLNQQWGCCLPLWELQRMWMPALNRRLQICDVSFCVLPSCLSCRLGNPGDADCLHPLARECQRC